MSSDFYNDYKNAVEQISEEALSVATARARYRVQEDYNKELVKEIANKTGHETLAATCFIEVDLESRDNLKVDLYTDDDIISGIYKSKSSFHQSGGKWSSVTEHYGMSRDEFWERRENGEEGNKNHGIIDTEWLTDNFWKGVYYVTNGWPLGDADFLNVYTYYDVSAESITHDYHNRYVNSNRFQKYIQEEIKAML